MGQKPSATGVSSFIWNDPARWRAQVRTYEQVSLGEVWAGVTVAVRARGGNVEKVFTIYPGASVDRIRVRVGGARALTVDAQGVLVARTDRGPVTFTPPIAYQERDGVRREVPVAYRPNGREYRFAVGAYDHTLPLVIDPLLQSTYLGGSDFDVAHALAIAPKTGDVYVAGQTSSADFPGTAGGAQPASGTTNAFVARLNGALTSLTQATYLGGSVGDHAIALAIAPMTGDVYVAGTTFSTDFPGTIGGAQPTHGGGGLSDVFVARLSSGLTVLIQATYLGGSGADHAFALAIAPTTGDIYVAGFTDSANFPGTAGGAQPTSGGGQDAFVARLTSGLTSLAQATYLGGTSTDEVTALAISPTTGGVYVAGRTASIDFPGTTGGAQPENGGNQDAFVARLNVGLSSLIQATYLGGSSFEEALALAIAPSTGDVYVAGITVSTDFPGTAGGAQPASAGRQDAFVARLSSGLNSLTQATYLGGSGDFVGSINVASALGIAPATGDVYVAGGTDSDNFPGAAGGVQPAFGGVADAFVARFPSSLTSLTQATYLGGSRSVDEALVLAIAPATGDVYVAGSTFPFPSIPPGSTDFPGTIGGAQPAGGGLSDAFVTRLSFSLAEADPRFGVSVLVSQPSFSAGETLTATVGLANPGLPRVADFYAGLLLPDGETLNFFIGPESIAVGRLTDLASFRTIAAGVSLGAPFAVTLPNFFSYRWTSALPHGAYVFFVLAVKVGAVAAGHVGSQEILGLGTAALSFP